MVKYRLRFRYKKENIVEKDRENNLNEILSNIDSIESDTPIRKPLDGEIIVISGQEYKVEGTTIAFEKDGDITYYDFIVLLKRNIQYSAGIDAKKSNDYLEEIIRRKMEERIREDKYDKYKRYNDYYKWTPPHNIFNSTLKYKSDKNFYI